MTQKTYFQQAKVLRTKRFARSQSVSPKVSDGVVSYDAPIPKTKEQLRLFQAKSLPSSRPAPIPTAPSKIVTSTQPPLTVPTVKITRGCGGCNRKLGS